MKERLIVKNFFALKNVDIELAKVNIFIGEQATGKSLVMKLVYFFRDNFYTPIKMFEDDFRTIKKTLLEEFSNIFHLYGSIEEFSITYLIDNYEITINKKLKLSIQFNLQVDVFYKNSRKKIIKDIITIKQSISDKTFTELPDSIKTRIVLSQVFDNKEFNNYNLLIPAGRSFFTNIFNNLFNLLSDSKSINLDKTYIDFGMVYQKVMQGWPYLFDFARKNDKKSIFTYFDSEITKIIKGKYVKYNNESYIQSGNIKLKIQHTSSGQQEVLPLYLVLMDYLSDNRVKSLFVEEPEAHLYPTAQKTLVELLVYITNTTNSDGLFITTHSPYVITVLNNLIMANEVKEKQTTFDKNLLLPYDNVRAYLMRDGIAESLMDDEYKLIDAERLDEVSEIISNEYDKLLDLKYDNQ